MEMPDSGREKERLGWAVRGLDTATAVSFAVYAASITVTPICLLLLSRELGFSLPEGGAAEAVRASLLVLALLASGWAAAHWGKIPVLGGSCLLLGLGLGLYSLAPTYAWVAMAMAVIGVGGGFIEALLNPLIQELHSKDSGRYLNVLNAFFPMGIFITVLGGGEWLTRGGSWRFVMFAFAVISLGAALMFLVFWRHGHLLVRRQAGDVLGHKIAILRNRRFWLFFLMMFLGGGAEGALTFWSASYIQLHFDQLPRMGGIGTAALAAGMFIGRLGCGWLVPQQKLWRHVLHSALAGTLLGLWLPLTNELSWSLAGLFGAGLCVACFWPSLQSYAADRIPLDATALFILLSCGGIPGYGLTPWLMGLIGVRYGLHISLFVVPAYLLVLMVCVLLERRYPPAEPLLP